MHFRLCVKLTGLLVK